ERIARDVPKVYRQLLHWKIEMARLALARGRTEEGRGLLREVADEARASLEKNPSLASIYLLSNRARALALLGESKEAAEALKRLDEQYRTTYKGDIPFWVETERARLFAVLGEREEALEALSRVAGRSDPCLDEDLAGLRNDPGFREMFPWCHAPRA